MSWAGDEQPAALADLEHPVHAVRLCGEGDLRVDVDVPAFDVGLHQVAAIPEGRRERMAPATVMGVSHGTCISNGREV